MAAIENEKAYALRIRESATDGSDFSNPEADYRMLFLGEDGLLHVKDSAGAVTDPYSPSFPARSAVSLTKSATQGPITTEAAITFDGEDFDDATYHDNSTNPSRITIATTGTYMVGGSFEATNFDDGTFAILRLRKNGSTVIHGRSRNTASGATQTMGDAFSKLVALTAGDYMELTLASDDAGGVTVRASADGTSFWAYRVA